LAVAIILVDSLKTLKSSAAIGLFPPSTFTITCNMCKWLLSRVLEVHRFEDLAGKCTLNFSSATVPFNASDFYFYGPLDDLLVHDLLENNSSC